MRTAIRERDRLLRRRIEEYLRRTKVAASRFGLEALGDPGFVFGLRNGRKVREKTARLVHAWLDARERPRKRRR